MKGRELTIALASITQAFACSLLTPLDDLGPSDADAATDSQTPFCASQAAPLFCDDFDEHPLGTGWTSQSVTIGALSLTAQPALSTPNALHSACPAQDAGACTARLSVDVASSASHFDFDFDVYLEDDAANTTTPNGAEIATLQFTNDAGRSYEVDLETDGQSLTVHDQGTGGDSSAASAFFAIGAWTHVHVGVDFATAQLTVSKNGTTAIAKALAAGSKAGSPRLVLGAYTSNPAQSIWDFDNVLIR